MYSQTLHGDRKYIRRYCFQFSMAKKLEKHGNDCFK